VSVSKIKADLPKDEYRNGLDAIAQALADDPHRKRVIIAIVDCGRVQYDHAEDADIDDIPPGLTATARIRRIEAVPAGDESLARRLLVRAYENRCGRVTLGFDTEADVLGINPETGEKLGGDGAA
jgi:hypothetical protein